MSFRADHPRAQPRPRDPEPAPPPARPGSAASTVIALQRAAGNRAVTALLARQPVDLEVAEPVLVPEELPRSNPETLVRPRVMSPPGPKLGIPELEPEKLDKRARELAEEYWQRLIDYHDRWGYWPWERGSQPKSSEYVYEVDPQQAAEDLREYRRARAILKREAQLPDTPTLKEIFLGGAAKAEETPAWYEQLLTDPVNTLATIKQETPEQLCELVAQSGTGIELTTDMIETMSTEELLKLLLQARVITQSCGQTAGLLHEVLSPSTVGNTPVKQDIVEIRNAIRRADDKAAEEKQYRYVRIEGGGHAFIVEVGGGRGRIYQSFWGTMTFAYDLARNASFPIDEFLELLSLALIPNEIGDTVAKEVETARRRLFNSAAVHPPGQMQVTEFAPESGASERLDQKFATMSSQWTTPLETPAKDQVAQPEEEDDVTPSVPKPSGTVTVSFDDRDWQFVDADTNKSAATADLQPEGEYYARYAGTHTLSLVVTSIDKMARTVTFEVD